MSEFWDDMRWWEDVRDPQFASNALAISLKVSDGLREDELGAVEVHL